MAQIWLELRGRDGQEYPPEKREQMSNVSVSVDDVDTSADVVEIPEKAVTVNGEPSKDGDTMVVKRDDKWWITFGGVITTGTRSRRGNWLGPPRYAA